MKNISNRREDWFEGIDLRSTRPSIHQSYVSRTLLAILCGLLLLFTGCDKDSRLHDLCVKSGICDRVPPPPGLFDIQCDSSDESSCTAATLHATTDAVLDSVAEAPGSVLRLWVFGEELTDIRPIVTLTVPTTTGGPAVRRSAQKRWKDHARGVIDAASNELFSRAVLRRSRIAEAFGEIARADNPDHLPRTIVYIGDRLEESAFGHFECQDLPSPDAFLARVQHAGVLQRDSLKDVHVTFAYGNTSRHPCPSLARDAKVEAIWSTLISKSGGTPEFYQEGLPQKEKE